MAFLLLDARTSNLLASIVNNIGVVLAAPFQGICA
jgi:hypothetical protein